MTGLYFFAQILIVLLTFALVYFFIRGQKYALNRLRYPLSRKRKLLYFTTAGILCWLGILGMLSFLGFFQKFDTVPPKIFLAVLPTVVLTLILVFSKSFFRLLTQIPPAWLVYIQSFRIVMELILWIGLLGGFVPFQMTFEGFNLDIVLGITALMAGYVFFARGRFRRLEAFLWNVFGIILLINIVFISVVSTPSAFRIFFNEPANTFIAYFPFIWIPGFIVPFALAMHLFSIKQVIYYKQLNRKET
jgi:hypothetical protein